MSMNTLYFEAHINLPFHPIHHAAYGRLKCLAWARKFKLSEMNGNDGHPDKEAQTILTTHTQDHEEMVKRVRDMLQDLTADGFTILRYKIEAATIDSRINDIWEMLS